jgi:hypothetical protein
MRYPRPETKLRTRFKNPVPIGELAKIYLTMEREFITTETADKYQDFFNFLNQEHDLICTTRQMNQIVKIINRLSDFQDFFNFLNKHFGITPTHTEMEDIIQEAKKLDKKLRK